MQTSDWINVVLCILSFVLAATSVITVVITLRQNQKMIENATRPYVAISYETACLAPKRNNRYIIVKNYGQSTAHISQIDCFGIQDDLFLRQLGNLQGNSLAPGQRRTYFLNDSINPTESVMFSCAYFGNGNKYLESTTLRLDDGSLVFRADKESYALQEIAERML